MDSPALVNQPAYQEGRRAFDAVKAARIPVRFGLWAYFYEANEWRFVLLIESAAREGPRAIYSLLQRVFTQNNVTIPLRQVTVTHPGEPLGVLVFTAAQYGETFSNPMSANLNVRIDTRSIYR